MGREGDWIDQSESSFEYSLVAQRELLVFVCITQRWKIPVGEQVLACCANREGSLSQRRDQAAG